MKGDVSPLLEAHTLLFSGYDDAYIKVNEERYESGLSLHQGEITAPWGPDRLRELKSVDLDPFVQQPPEVLILGTGRVTAFPSADVLDYMTTHHIGFECMDSRAAARTYNILIGEGRRVSVAMLLPGARN